MTTEAELIEVIRDARDMLWDLPCCDPQFANSDALGVVNAVWYMLHVALEETLGVEEARKRSAAR